MLGYLEQSAAISVINALSAVGYCKPKYPFVDPTKSALAYLAYHLKGKDKLIKLDGLFPSEKCDSLYDCM